MRLAIKLVVIIGILAACNPAFACSCSGGIDIVDHFKRTNAVFVGTVQKVTHNENRFKQDGHDLIGPGTIDVTFKVTRAIKGVNVGDVVVVTTSDQSSACGIQDWLKQKAGDTWVVWAGVNVSSGRLSAGHCSRTRAMADAGEDLRFFDSLGK